MDQENNKKILLTTEFSPVDAPLSLQRMCALYLPADIYHRYLKMQGKDVVCIGGSNDYHTSVTRKAHVSGKTPRATVQEHMGQLKDVLAKWQIDFSKFSGTSNLVNVKHATFVREVFTSLYKKKYIQGKLNDQLFSSIHQAYLPESCFAGEATTKEQENPFLQSCFPFSETELKKDEEKPKLPRKDWYLKLEPFKAQWESWIKEQSLESIKEMAELKNFVPSFSITGECYWGIPVPIEDGAKKVIWPWVESLLAYLSTTQELLGEENEGETWKSYWKKESTEVIHFVTEDTLGSHLLVWPILLMAQELDLPSAFVAQSAHDIPVFPAEKVSEKFDVNLLRYYLSSLDTGKEKNNIFSWKDFQKSSQQDFIKNTVGFSQRVLKFVDQKFSGEVPSGENLGDDDKKLLEQCLESESKIKQAYDNMSWKEVISEVASLSEKANQYFNQKAPWKKSDDPSQTESCLYVGIQVTKKMALLLSPIIPQWSKSIYSQLNLEGEVSWSSLSEKVPGGQKINAKDSYDFPKVSEKQWKELQKRETESEGASKAPANSPKEQVTYDDFARLDIRIGEVIEAKKIEKADKLLQLQVKIGEETRQIIAGIAQYYTPEQVLGKKLPILVNLKPAKLRGLISEGMILCADVKGAAVFLNPDKDVPSGSTVR